MFAGAVRRAVQRLAEAAERERAGTPTPIPGNSGGAAGTGLSPVLDHGGSSDGGDACDSADVCGALPLDHAFCARLLLDDRAAITQHLEANTAEAAKTTSASTPGADGGGVLTARGLRGPVLHLHGWPRSPLCDELAAAMLAWVTSDTCPLEALPSAHLLNESPAAVERTRLLRESQPIVEQLAALLSTDQPQTLGANASTCTETTAAKERQSGAPPKAKQEEQESDRGQGPDQGDEQANRYPDHDDCRAQSPTVIDGLVETWLGVLGMWGVRFLLGVRRTQGSVARLPPPLNACLASFDALHKPQSASKLTCGARALAKHCHRDQSTSFWGASTGSIEAKNKHARHVLAKLLSDVTWLNVHLLPHDLAVFEIRNSESYGARWSADGSEFRGFLEPQMEDGHDVGWRH
eukprot:m.32086 g.32086  ORF g.32086 m.32086 type:complete len:408 (-) comp9931_c0_seq2:325-1548(-)